MADETTPNPRVAHIDAEIARAREKLEAANQRVTDLEKQIVGLEFQLEQELGRAEPAPAPTEE